MNQRNSVCLLFAVPICLLAGCNTDIGSKSSPAAILRAERILVIIVPGTYGNDEHWPMILRSKQTFASELVRGLRGDVVVHPFVWSSSIRGTRRIEVAQVLADDIDRLARDYDRVILIGHSHGGNIALLAAGTCATTIDTIVCLSTPHVYLRVVDAQETALNLPVYCSRRTLQNTQRILCYRAEGDMVPEAWSSALLTGVSETEALELTRDWRTLTGSPRLADDQFILRLLESDNIVASGKLTVAFHNEVIPCEVHDVLGIRQHHVVHSCPVGYALGTALSERATGQNLLDRLPANADCGVR